MERLDINVLEHYCAFIKETGRHPGINTKDARELALAYWRITVALKATKEQTFLILKFDPDFFNLSHEEQILIISLPDDLSDFDCFLHILLLQSHD